VRPASEVGSFSKAATAFRGMAWISDAPSALIFTIVAVAPFPFASVAPAVVAILCAVAGFAIIGFALQRPIVPAPALMATAIVVIVLGYVLVLYLQVIPRAPNDRLAHPIWAEASGLIGRNFQTSASIARDQPYYAVGAPLLTLMMFVGGYFCGSDDRLARRLLRVIAWAGGCYAVYAILSYAIEPTMVLWQQKDAYTSNLTGTFTNRNAAAVYFGSISVLWLIIFFRRLGLRRRRRHRHGEPSKRWGQRFALPTAGFVTCLLALLLTGSRAGVACSFAGLLVAFAITFRRTLSEQHRRWLLAGGTAFVVLMVYEVFDSNVGDRLQTEGLADGGRINVVGSVLKMIADRPVIGTGLGTFRWSFSAYRSGEISGWGVYDKAHNVLLEIAAEGGVLLAGLVFLVWALAIGILLMATRRPRMPALSIAALSIATIAILHSLVDFSMQIPAYSITVVAIVGAGLAQALQPHQTDPDPVKIEKAAPPVDD
jgi:O-antigen ligase